MENKSGRISDVDCIDFLIKELPKFCIYWESNKDKCAQFGLTIQLDPFCDYAIDVIKTNDENQLKKIFDCVEFLICEGDEKVANAMTTVFLEYLMNMSPDKISFKTVAKFLGKESIGYCRAWDTFCGIKSEGLW